MPVMMNERGEIVELTPEEFLDRFDRMSSDDITVYDDAMAVYFELGEDCA